MVAITKKTIGLSLAMLVLGAVIGAFLYRGFDLSTSPDHHSEESYAAEEQAKHPLLSKRIFIDNPNDIILNFSELRSSMKLYTQTEAKGVDVSVYFEYLPTGASVRINDTTELVAASLMKIPVVMTFYNLAEQGKIQLDETFVLKKEWLNSQFGTLYKKGEGYRLTWREAAKLMLRDSDNTAALAIQAKLKELGGRQDDALRFIDLDYNVTQTGTVEIGPRSYSSILKCLYFSCYLKQNHSNELLGYLTESSFKDRLTALLPQNVKVAHKIGTYSDSYQSDCGVIYLEKRNYILCIMVKADDPQASRIIADISKMTYVAIDGFEVNDKQ